MTSSTDEAVPLTESSDVLQLLFQYIYPQRHPNLKAIDFTTLAGLAEAAEKYQVYSAMDVCSILMEYVLQYIYYQSLTCQSEL